MDANSCVKEPGELLGGSSDQCVFDVPFVSLQFTVAESADIRGLEKRLSAADVTFSGCKII